MKRILSTMLILFLVIAIAGCSTTKSNQNIEEEQESDNIQVQTPDVHNKDSVYEFIKSNYPQYSKDDMDKWTIQYLDITGDSIDEAIFTAEYGDGKLESAIIITAQEDEYREISRYIPLAKYENHMGMKDGFLVHNIKTGGSGAYQDYMDLYYYDGTYLTVTRRNIKLKETVNTPLDNYEITSNIDGDLKDFIITYTRKDLDNDKEEIIAKDEYKFNGNNMLDRTPVSLSNKAKSFDSVYKGDNMFDTIKYFNDNLYSFGENEMIDFAQKLFNVVLEEHSSMTEWGEFIPLPNEFFNKETLEYDITGMTDEQYSFTLDVLNRLKDSTIFVLVKPFFANEGEIYDNGFNIMISDYAYQMLKPAFELLLHKGEVDQSIFLKPDIYFNADYMSVKKVTQTHIVYPNFVVDSYDDLEALEGEETWKTNVLMRLNIVGETD